MKGVIFDLDGVLVDSMPMHFLCWKTAFQNVASIRISERNLYLLEGMRGIELIAKIFKRRGFSDPSLAQKVSDEKDRLFAIVGKVKPFEGVKEMICRLQCSKSVVSGSGRQDVETILDREFGLDNFSAIITASDIKKGKPDPAAFLAATEKMDLMPKDVVVVENAPLGVIAANNADISCYVVLNNTRLKRSDFAGVITHERIFDRTSSLKGLLEKMCLR